MLILPPSSLKFTVAVLKATSQYSGTARKYLQLAFATHVSVLVAREQVILGYVDA
jgi:hypothetical protein